ncbi:hypothetical protein CC78DRAFT_528089 [Lojkania enalia]|uniref:SWR1-complex protein 3 domain-containing protein n=1 Tax=Lojkania enalia TaxID=147567 RepID=A0A9P4NDN0_9PLEO|nr:hypothetical protein CC78DRAFT_528089 [Didymosphaeria enalia]
MSEPRRSTRARAREEAAPPPPPDPPKETPAKKPAKPSLKRKRTFPVEDSTPNTPAPESVPEEPKTVLPTKLVEGKPLPTLPEPQPADLPAREYQSIQESGILSASLQRSRAVWISGSNFRLFHAFFTPPKKVADRTDEDKQAMQRQKEIIRNFPQLGNGVEAQLVIEPHTFPIRLYGPREVIRATQKKQPMYGHWPNHNQYSPYQQYNNSPTPYAKPSTPQQRPSQPKPPQQKPPPPKPTGPTTPAPDPVIHMLAQRAGVDPELKAVMKIVAEGKATKQQLEFFQGHINELTSILAKQKEAAAKAPPPPQPTAPPAPAPAAPAPAPPTPSAPSFTHPPPQPVQQNVPKPYSPAPRPTPQTPVPSGPSHQSHYSTSYNAHSQPQQHPHAFSPGYHQSQPPLPPPPLPSYRPLVFDFVEGNGDKFYFPSYSFSEWLPNNQGAKFSFLVTKMKSKPESKPEDVPPSTPAPKAAPPSTPGPAAGTTPGVTPNATPSVPITVCPDPNMSTPAPTMAPKPPTPYNPPPRIEDFDEKNDIKDIDFYQPVTLVLLTTNYEILQSLPRAIRHPDIVEKYMNEVFDTCRRADETYLAFRLPKEGITDPESEDKRVKDDVVTPTVSTPVADVVMGGMGSVADKRRAIGRPRKSLVV